MMPIFRRRVGKMEAGAWMPAAFTLVISTDKGDLVNTIAEMVAKGDYNADVELEIAQEKTDEQ